MAGIRVEKRLVLSVRALKEEPKKEKIKKVMEREGAKDANGGEG